MKAVILSSNGDILGLLNEVAGRTVVVAGAIATNGSPVNRSEFKVSSSKANLARAAQSDAEYASRHEHNGMVFYTLN